MGPRPRGTAAAQVSQALKKATAAGTTVRGLVLCQAEAALPFFGAVTDLLQAEAPLLATWEKLVSNLRELPLLLLAAVEGTFHEVRGRLSPAAAQPVAVAALGEGGAPLSEH